MKKGNKVKKCVLGIVAKISMQTAKSACGAASWWDCYQPKEPEILKKMKKRN